MVVLAVPYLEKDRILNSTYSLQRNFVYLFLAINNDVIALKYAQGVCIRSGRSKNDLLA